MNGRRTCSVDDIEAAYRRVIRRGQLIALSALFSIAAESGKIEAATPILNGPWGLTIVLGTYLLALVIPIATVLGNRCHLRDLAAVAFGRLTWWQAIIVGCMGSVASDFVTDRIIRGLGVEPIFDVPRDLTDFVVGVVDLDILLPLTETIVFQVVLQSLLRRFGMIPAAIATTALFAAYHFMSIDRLPNHVEAVTVLAIACSLAIFAFIRATTGSTLAVLLAHGGSNALNYLFATPHHIQ